MSKESPPVREVIPFKPGKRQSTFRRLNLDFAGTALEEALARQQQQTESEEKQQTEEKETPLTPVTGVKKDTELTPVTPVTPVTGDKKRRIASQSTVARADAAPKRDFTRAANSIVRDAIPAGIFTGKGKHLYDYLYSQTRGAITPVHAARIPTDKVMAGAGMTRNTFRFHLERLCNAGLIIVEQRPGEHGGNVYTVLLPEEVGLQGGDRGERGDRGDRGENLPLVQGSKVDPSNPSLSPNASTPYRQPKTLYKTDEQNTDDEAFAELIAIFQQASRELTGKEQSATERARWGELAELIVAELKIAAARTGQVSNVPAFLTEHLRRRLWKKDKAQLEKEAARELEPQQGLDTSKCPDCGGSGWWYPEGTDRGVAKCKHARLKQAEQG